MTRVDTVEFRTRLNHIDECLKQLEREVDQLRAQGSANWPRLERVEGDLRSAEKELSALQGIGGIHSTRLDTIDHTLRSLKDDIGRFHGEVLGVTKEHRDDFAEHVRTEEMWQKKVFYGLIMTVSSGIITLVIYLFQKLHP